VNLVKDRASLIKKIFLYFSFAVSFILVLRTVSEFVQRQEYFSISTPFSTSLIGYLLLSICILAVISQTLQKTQEIIFPSLIIYIFSFIFLSNYKFKEALIGSSVVFLIFLYGIRRTFFLKDNLTKLKVRHSARNTVNSFLFVVNVLAAFSVFLVSEHVSSINVGQRVADITEKPIKEAVLKEYEGNTENINIAEMQNYKESDSQLLTVLKSLGITGTLFEEPKPNDEKTQEGLGNISNSIKNSIAKKVNDIVEPYRRFFSPTLALLVFGIFQIYSWITYILYSQLINLIFLILRKTHFVKVEKVPAEKETLSF